jgi:phosphotransferase system  glucose/maltose/N-acetylglucosamine-specific IIC component
MEDQSSQKYKWETIYTIVLVVNAIYFILFYFLMNTFS